MTHPPTNGAATAAAPYSISASRASPGSRRSRGRFPAEMKFAEQLVEVQRLMAAGDERARRIYETIGICFGYSIAHFASFYEIRNLLILGRVTSGEGGEIIIEKAREVLRAEFPTLAEAIQLRTPDEKDKRHGQAVAAASLPALRK